MQCILAGSIIVWCSQLVVAGRTGIFVAGGIDNNLAPTNTVEFLDLGESPGSSLQWTELRWRNLPELSRPRAHLVLVRRGPNITFQPLGYHLLTEQTFRLNPCSKWRHYRIVFYPTGVIVEKCPQPGQLGACGGRGRGQHGGDIRHGGGAMEAQQLHHRRQGGAGSRPRYTD